MQMQKPSSQAFMYNNPKRKSPIHGSQLDIIVHQPHLLARLERRQANVRTAVTTESVAQRAVATRAHLALHCEVDLCQVVGVQFSQVGIGVGTLRGVFGVQALGETAAAVFAGPAALGVGLAGFGWEGC